MRQKEKILDSEKILASAVYFLLEGRAEKDRDAATILLSCSLEVTDVGVDWERDSYGEASGDV